MKCNIKNHRGNLPIILVATAAFIILASTLTLQITTKAKMGVSLREDKKYDVDLDSSVELVKNMFMTCLESQSINAIYKGNDETPTSGLIYLNNDPSEYSDLFTSIGSNAYINHESGGKTKMLNLMDEKLVAVSIPLNIDLDAATSSVTFNGLSLNNYNLLSLFNKSNPTYISSETATGMKTTSSCPPILFEIKVENQNRTLTAKFTVIGINIVRIITNDSGSGSSRVCSAKFTADISDIKFNLTDIKLIQNVAGTTYSAEEVMSNMGYMGVSTYSLSNEGTQIGSDIKTELMTQCLNYSGYPYKMIHDEGCIVDPPQYLDCSAFVWKVFNKAGLETPLLTTREMVQSDAWVWIPFSEIQQGDILIGVGNSRHHTMVYIGYQDGKHYVFEASNPSRLSGISTYRGETFDTNAIVKPVDINNNLFYAYRHASLVD